MAVPTSRGQLINFGLRKLGYPVLEINLDTDQIHDALDDTIQLYQERHYNGIERMFLKYKITQDDICLLYTSPSPRDKRQSRMPSSA